jgi:hypothetical protein
MSAAFNLRRHYFQVCISAVKHTSRLGAIFREIVMFLQGVEMGHILMIDRYIFGKYSEFIRMGLLEIVRPRRKLLFSRDERAALNRNNFSLLATAAVPAAQTGTPSMQFHRGGNTSGTSGALIEPESI